MSPLPLLLFTVAVVAAVTGEKSVIVDTTASVGRHQPLVELNEKNKNSDSDMETDSSNIDQVSNNNCYYSRGFCQKNLWKLFTF